MWFGWNGYGWGPWGPNFGPIYGPYGYGYGPGPYYGPGYGAQYNPGYNTQYNTGYNGGYNPGWEEPYDYRKMELMALKEELNFMSYRVNEILNRIDELEREMR